MEDAFSRTRLLLGSKAMEKLACSRVAVFGLGGVGGHVCEALVRSGVGALDLIDADRVALSNLNRQIIATRKTVGRLKTEVMRERMLEINPEVSIHIETRFVLPENIETFPFDAYDYVVDAMDTVAAKLALIQQAEKNGTPVISSMGAGNKLDAGRFRVADIRETSVCPLARVMRRELKKRGIEKLKVVYSDEPPLRSLPESCLNDPKAENGHMQDRQNKNLSEQEREGCALLTEEDPERTICPDQRQRRIPGSTAFVPAVAGLLIAGEVIRDLCADEIG